MARFKFNVATFATMCFCGARATAARWKKGEGGGRGSEGAEIRERGRKADGNESANEE